MKDQDGLWLGNDDLDRPKQHTAPHHDHVQQTHFLDARCGG